MGESVAFERRDFSGPVWVDGVNWTVERLEWQAVGGPWAGRLRADPLAGAAGDQLARLWGLADLLRCGVVVSDELGPGWWGYASVLEIHSGSGTIRISLEDMANDIFASYRVYSPLSSGGVRINTNSVKDDESIQVFGTKQASFALGQVSGADASAFALTRLNQISKPVVTTEVGAAPAAGVVGKPYALLYLRGWWYTLDWKFYKDSRGQVANLNGGSQQKLGDIPSDTKLAQSVTVSGSWSVSEIWIRGARVLEAGAGVAWDNLRVDLCADSGGVPGSSLGNVSMLPADIQDEVGWLRFALSSPVAVSTGTYHIVVTRSGGLDTNQYFVIGVDQGLGYLDGSLLLWNGDGWVTRMAGPGLPDADLTFAMIGVEDTGLQLVRVLGSADGAGQFMSAARMKFNTGIMGRMYHEGSNRGRQEAENFLKMGTVAGFRLLARVDADRSAVVYAQPAVDTAEAMLGRGGRLVRGDGQPLPLSAAPAGQWVKLAELALPGLLMGYNGAAFVERCYWDGDGLKIG